MSTARPSRAKPLRAKPDLYGLLALREGLRFEIQGIKVRNGLSCFSILKSMGFGSNRKAILELLTAEINRQLKYGRPNSTP